MQTDIITISDPFLLDPKNHLSLPKESEFLLRFHALDTDVLRYKIDLYLHRDPSNDELWMVRGPDAETGRILQIHRHLGHELVKLRLLDLFMAAIDGWILVEKCKKGQPDLVQELKRLQKERFNRKDRLANEHGTPQDIAASAILTTAERLGLEPTPSHNHAENWECRCPFTPDSHHKVRLNPRTNTFVCRDCARHGKEPDFHFRATLGFMQAIAPAAPVLEGRETKTYVWGTDPYDGDFIFIPHDCATSTAEFLDAMVAARTWKEWSEISGYTAEDLEGHAEYKTFEEFLHALDNDQPHEEAEREWKEMGWPHERPPMDDDPFYFVDWDEFGLQQPNYLFQTVRDEMFSKLPTDIIRDYGSDEGDFFQPIITFKLDAGVPVLKALKEKGFDVVYDQELIDRGMRAYAGDDPGEAQG